MSNTDLQKYGGRGQTISANTDTISEIVGRAANDLSRSENVEKVSLHDMGRIRDISRGYLNECAAVGCLPSVRGVASRLGLTRQSLYDYADHHRGGEFDTWLKDFSDLCGELTMEAAMSGSVKEVSAIFTAKSRYGWRDTISIEAVPAETPLGPEPDAAAIAAKYSMMDTEE